MKFFSIMLDTPRRGFTLIELLVVIAIIGMLSSITLASVNTARLKSQNARAQTDLREIGRAVELLVGDTGVWPDGNATKPSNPCVWPYNDAGNEVSVNLSQAGIMSTDGGFPSWKGPYLKTLPRDPWGVNYFFDADYQCSADTVGCHGQVDTENYSVVVQSFGPNHTQDYGGGDDIVYYFCTRP